MNVIDFKKYFNPRSQVRNRAINFAEILKQRHGINDDDIAFAFGTRKNYRYVSIHLGKGNLNDVRY
jgi:hypothetical protein